MYVKKFTLAIFGQEQLDFLGVDLDTAALYLGSFIYPKYMIRYLNDENPEKQTVEQKANN